MTPEGDPEEFVPAAFKHSGACSLHERLPEYPTRSGLRRCGYRRCIRACVECAARRLGITENQLVRAALRSPDGAQVK